MSALAVPGPKILLLGDSGSGKTHSIRTLLEAGLKVFVNFTEPGMEVLLDTRVGKAYTCAEGLHWHYIPPATPGWGELLDATDKINKFSFKALAEMSDIQKGKYREMYQFVASHSNLKCDRCGVSFGAADKLEPADGWAIVDDSLSGISVMCMNNVVGGKPVAAQADWGVAMKNLENYITTFVGSIPSLAVMIGHLERETDEVTGQSVNMASTLGRKLAPKIPRFFSDVILTRREGTKFSWSTSSMNTAVKARNVPIADNLPPTFAPIVKAWKDRLAAEASAVQANAQLAAALPAKQG